MKTIFTILSFFFCILSYGQSKDTLPNVTTSGFNRVTRGKPFWLEITKDTKIFDKITGVEISFQEYQKRKKERPYGYFAEPIYDEFGQPSSFYLREATPTEEQKRVFKMQIDRVEKTKIGDEIPSFVMTDMNGQVYTSKDLKGKNVVLLFFPMARFAKSPFFNTDDYKKIVEEFSIQNIVFITVFSENIDDEVPETTKFFTTPIVSEGRGFQIRFGTKSGSEEAFIIVDKNSKVYGYAPSAPGLDDLTKLLKEIPK